MHNCAGKALCPVLSDRRRSCLLQRIVGEQPTGDIGQSPKLADSFAT